MKRIILYAASLAAFVFLLKWLEYKYLIRDLTMEFYLGLVAVLFASLGIWMGLRLTRKKEPLPPSADYVRNEAFLEQSGISQREYDVLVLLAGGLSNQEIAERLFVSTNTVKTHISNLYIKLDVKRRTQAVQVAKAQRLIP